MGQHECATSADQNGHCRCNKKTTKIKNCRHCNRQKYISTCYRLNMFLRSCQFGVCAYTYWSLHSVSTAGSTQAAAAAEKSKEWMKGRRRLHKKERQKKEVPAQTPSVSGAELLQSESPYRKKAGSSQAQQPCTHKHILAHIHAGAEQQQGQHECSECTAALYRKWDLFRLKALCKE